MSTLLTVEQLATLDDVTLKALGKTAAYKDLVLDVKKMRHAGVKQAFDTNGVINLAGFEVPAFVVPFIAMSKVAGDSNGAYNTAETFPKSYAVVEAAKAVMLSLAIAIGDDEVAPVHKADTPDAIGFYSKGAVNANGVTTPYEPLRQFTEALL